MNQWRRLKHRGMSKPQLRAEIVWLNKRMAEMAEDAKPKGRDRIFVHTDHNPDEVRVFFEVPEAIYDRIQPTDSTRTFASHLADMLDGCRAH